MQQKWWWICGGLGGALVSAFAPEILDEPYKYIGLAIGIILVATSGIGLVWQTLSEGRGAAPRLRRMWPISRNGRGPFQFDRWFPFRRLIPLSDVARTAYAEMPNAVVTRINERLDGGPQRMIGRFAEWLAGDGSVQVFGINPATGVLVEIARSEVEEFMFSDDGSEMFDQWEPTRRYTQLKIKRSDAPRLIAALKERLGEN